MKRFWGFIGICVVLVMWAGVGLLAQPAPRLKTELDRLENRLRQAESLMRVIRNPQIRQKVQQQLKQAYSEYQKARQFFLQKKFRQATLHIRAAYAILRNLENIFKDQPYFKFKFKEELDRRIQEAERRLQGVDDPQALRMLNRAKFFRRRANLALRQQRPMQALEFLRLAMFFADNAIRLVEKGPGGREGDFPSMFARAEELFQQLQQLALQEERPRWRSALTRLEQQLQEARQLFENRKPQLAIDKLRAALHAMYRWIDQLENESQPPRLQEEYQRFLMAFQELRPPQGAAPDRVAQTLFRRLNALSREIQQHLQKQEFQLAREKLRVANRLLYRLEQRRQNGMADREDIIRQQIEMTRSAMEQLRQDIPETTETRPLIQLVEEYYQKSRWHLENGHFMQASIHLNIANQLMTKLYQLNVVREGGDIDRSRVEAEMNRLERLLERINQGEIRDARQQATRQTAERLLQVARQAYERGHRMQAWEITRFALKLLTR
ncbi:MAG: hypothetical protein GXO78_09960 [Calditrichaeota bacterium]|nr:hypothetical protein [Calditrichota bacterium]